MGTQAFIRLIVEPQTEAIELEPLHVVISLTTLIVYGNSSSLGKTGINAFSAKAQCHISLLQTHLSILTSQVENGGKL
ncbi:MAG: hypothetical protein LBD88_01130 [Candidatus Peribacteria bacterium]|jgi:hypothetical protein|nr:hypothetical protein [Candidatus Peribacteria bacterium]